FAPAEAALLIGDAYPVRRTMYGFRERRAGELRTIVLAREMRCDQMLQTRRVDPREKLRRGCVVEMTEAARDALLERGGIVSVREHVEIVVAFEHQRVAAGQARFDVSRAGAEIGEDAQPPAPVRAYELDRLARIVRHRKRTHFDIADRKHVVAIEA